MVAPIATPVITFMRAIAKSVGRPLQRTTTSDRRSRVDAIAVTSRPRRHWARGRHQSFLPGVQTTGLPWSPARTCTIRRKVQRGRLLDIVAGVRKPLDRRDLLAIAVLV